MSKAEEIVSLLRSEISYFKKLKSAIGDIHGHIHSLAVRAAKIYLAEKHPEIVSWKVSEEYGSGLDIIGKAKDGKMVVVAEVKTTARSEKETLGKMQKNKIINDIERLEGTGAEYKYLFIIDDKNRKAIENIFTNKQVTGIELLNIFECQL